MTGAPGGSGTYGFRKFWGESSDGRRVVFLLVALAVLFVIVIASWLLLKQLAFDSCKDELEAKYGDNSAIAYLNDQDCRERTGLN